MIRARLLPVTAWTAVLATAAVCACHRDIEYPLRGTVVIARASVGTASYAIFHAEFFSEVEPVPGKSLTADPLSALAVGECTLQDPFALGPFTLVDEGAALLGSGDGIVLTAPRVGDGSYDAGLLPESDFVPQSEYEIYLPEPKGWIGGVSTPELLDVSVPSGFSAGSFQRAPGQPLDIAFTPSATADELELTVRDALGQGPTCRVPNTGSFHVPSELLLDEGQVALTAIAYQFADLDGRPVTLLGETTSVAAFTTSTNN